MTPSLYVVNLLSADLSHNAPGTMIHGGYQSFGTTLKYGTVTAQ